MYTNNVLMITFGRVSYTNLLVRTYGFSNQKKRYWWCRPQVIRPGRVYELGPLSRIYRFQPQGERLCRLIPCEFTDNVILTFSFLQLVTKHGSKYFHPVRVSVTDKESDRIRIYYTSVVDPPSQT
jgi:hypothetical protein